MYVDNTYRGAKRPYIHSRRPRQTEVHLRRAVSGMADYTVRCRLHLYRATQIAYFGVAEPSLSVIVINKNIVRLDICSSPLAGYHRVVALNGKMSQTYLYVPYSSDALRTVPPAQPSPLLWLPIYRASASAAYLQHAECCHQDIQVPRPAGPRSHRLVGEKNYGLEEAQVS